MLLRHRCRRYFRHRTISFGTAFTVLLRLSAVVQALLHLIVTGGCRGVAYRKNMPQHHLGGVVTFYDTARNVPKIPPMGRNKLRCVSTSPSWHRSHHLAETRWFPRYAQGCGHSTTRWCRNKAPACHMTQATHLSTHLCNCSVQKISAKHQHSSSSSTRSSSENGEENVVRMARCMSMKSSSPHYHSILT